MTDRPTIGEEFRRTHPDWPHECCYDERCMYRVGTADGRKTCISPDVCEYCTRVETDDKEVTP